MTPRHLYRLKHLRDVVFPHVMKMEKEGKVDLDVYATSCDTPGCLLGWAASDPVFMSEGLHIFMNRGNEPQVSFGKPAVDYSAGISSRTFFGVGNIHIQLFSSQAGGRSIKKDLLNRKCRLDTIIKEAEDAL